MGEEIYSDDFMIIRKHSGQTDHRVSVQVGNPPEEATPTVVDAREVKEALDNFIEG